jgi:pullulanase/glycogen debranching enzyme
LTNFWGYNSIAFLAPHVGYATGGLGQQVSEFKSMVRTLHRAGLEVILDVVYNHTGEGNQLGPTLSLRGIDNSVYYRLMPDQPQYHLDYTGTGNSLNILHPRAMGLVTDSLRYWVTDMHVDGFRFDLAPVLVRGYEAGQPSAFFEIIQQDPVLSKVKLIAEPWDASPDGYQLGQFPTGWSAGRPRAGPRAGVTPHGKQRHLRAEWAPDVRQYQLRHLSRRFHPDRPRHLRAQAQRGQRRGQSRRGTGQRQSQLGGRGTERLGAHSARP